MSDPWAAIAADTRLKLANDETVIEKNRAKAKRRALRGWRQKPRAIRQRIAGLCRRLDREPG